jgi:pSer/pThr/pTyr-binding forkhead associated (FHA) protein
MHLDTQTLVKQARVQTRDEFVAALPYLFLIVSTPDDSGKHSLMRALTATADSEALPPLGMRALEIIPIRKREGGTHPDRISVGRAASCDVVLKDPSISKLQAWFRVEPGTPAQLTDFDSHNGTRINGHPLPPNEATAVEVGDHLEFGRMSCKLLDAGRLHDLLRTLGSLNTAPAHFKR